MHTSEQMVHRNVCPQSIVLTPRGDWKLAGFCFAEKVKDGKVSLALRPAHLQMVDTK